MSNQMKDDMNGRNDQEDRGYEGSQQYYNDGRQRYNGMAEKSKGRR